MIEGAFVDKNIFNATNVFAKHDENYMPASIKEDLKDTGYWNKNINEFISWFFKLSFCDRY